MSKKYSTVKMYYDRHLWNLQMVRNAVVKGWITKEEFKFITRKEY